MTRWATEVTGEPSLLHHVVPLACTLLMLLMDAWRFLRLCLRPSPALTAENLFLRKQLALYQERQTKPRGATPATRMALACLARWFDWRQALVLVQPRTVKKLESTVPTAVTPKCMEMLGSDRHFG